MLTKTEIIAYFCSYYDDEATDEWLEIFVGDNYKSWTSSFFIQKYDMSKNTFKIKFIQFVVNDLKLTNLQLHNYFPNIFTFDATERALYKSVVKESLEIRDQSKKPIVIFVFGDAGTGKSKLCSEQFKPIDTFITMSNLKWFNGYLQQSICVFEDFRLNDWTNASLPYFLRLLDRYQMTVEVKGSTVQFNSPFIAVNTIFSKEVLMSKYQFSKQEDVEKEQDNQLFRRIDVEILLTVDQRPQITINNTNISSCYINDDNKIIINGKTLSQLKDDWDMGVWDF